MPRKFEGYAPDAIDCNEMWSSICSTFACIPELETRYERDKVTVICRCRKLGAAAGGEVQVQALVARPLRTSKDLFVMQYSALLECWHQLDRGVFAVAQSPIERGWDGRPGTARRARK